MHAGLSQVYEALGPALEESLRLLAKGSEPQKEAANCGTADGSTSPPASTPHTSAASPSPQPKDAIVTDLDRCGLGWLPVQAALGGDAAVVQDQLRAYPASSHSCNAMWITSHIFGLLGLLHTSS